MKIENNLKRKCIVTNEIIDVSFLVRFDFKKDNNSVSIDWDKNKKGRGAYFIPSEENWLKLIKIRALNRAFRTNVSSETYEKLDKELKEYLWAKKIQE
ncbi:YlxR family protein [Mycoplasmopsis canis]|uniref:YlxR family protein n=1 Tax=Mycoplasmopsis canis TaxID=29555 RepID=UPI00025ADA29|nr:YlxR family protein [Mycoplasmopsis canis]EIE40663.1 hypothetical protein MCANUF33_00883 [Mycoplasmopsis canis UF33]EIE41945.1 hypothetical protein MCANUFG1_00843 [Mycoplasmopsis canis UFG1]WQQ12525.1 YlxR family protein [Mycoplasmopsis canis]